MYRACGSYEGPGSKPSRQRLENVFDFLGKAICPAQSIQGHVAGGPHTHQPGSDQSCQTFWKTMPGCLAGRLEDREHVDCETDVFLIVGEN